MSGPTVCLQDVLVFDEPLGTARNVLPDGTFL